MSTLRGGTPISGLPFGLTGFKSRNQLSGDGDMTSCGSLGIISPLFESQFFFFETTGERASIG